MNYPLESLTPEKFQQLVQALLTKEFPNLHCFPVAQPDGGRDAVQPLLFATTPGFIMFQGQFVRAISSGNDPHKWLISTIKKEAPKVNKQILKVAKQYVLVSNVPGTAHPGTGSIDLVDKILTQEIKIPAVCWWRDDICRRLDGSWDLKWAYPELMTGPDLIRYTIENRQDKERRSSARKEDLPR